MKTKNKINFKMYIILLYITSRKPIRQCSSQKFDYLFSLQGYIQEVVKSPRRKKSHCPDQKPIQFVHGPTTVREIRKYV